MTDRVSPDLKTRSLRDELAFLLDSTVDLPATAYDRDTLLMRLETAFGVRNRVLVEALQGLVDAADRLVALARSETGDEK